MLFWFIWYISWRQEIIIFNRSGAADLKRNAKIGPRVVCSLWRFLSLILPAYHRQQSAWEIINVYSFPACQFYIFSRPHNDQIVSKSRPARERVLVLPPGQNYLGVSTVLCCAQFRPYQLTSSTLKLRTEACRSLKRHLITVTTDADWCK